MPGLLSRCISGLLHGRPWRLSLAWPVEQVQQRLAAWQAVARAWPVARVHQRLAAWQAMAGAWHVARVHQRLAAWQAMARAWLAGCRPRAHHLYRLAGLTIALHAAGSRVLQLHRLQLLRQGGLRWRPCWCQRQPAHPAAPPRQQCSRQDPTLDPQLQKPTLLDSSCTVGPTVKLSKSSPAQRPAPKQ